MSCHFEHSSVPRHRVTICPTTY